MEMELCRNFKKDPVRSYIVVEVEIYRNGEMAMLTVCHSRYVQRIIEQLGLELKKGQTWPINGNSTLQQDPGECMQPYREAIGGIMYLKIGTGPDVAFPYAYLQSLSGA